MSPEDPSNREDEHERRRHTDGAPHDQRLEEVGQGHPPPTHVDHEEGGQADVRDDAADSPGAGNEHGLERLLVVDGRRTDGPQRQGDPASRLGPSRRRRSAIAASSRRTSTDTKKAASVPRTVRRGGASAGPPGRARSTRMPNDDDAHGTGARARTTRISRRGCLLPHAALLAGRRTRSSP